MAAAYAEAPRAHDGDGGAERVLQSGTSIRDLAVRAVFDVVCSNFLQAED